MSDKPAWWFRTIEELAEDFRGEPEPQTVEYLKADTGETFVHTGGTAFRNSGGEWYLEDMQACGITHAQVIVSPDDRLPHYSSGGADARLRFPRERYDYHSSGNRDA